MRARRIHRWLTMTALTAALPLLAASGAFGQAAGGADPAHGKFTIEEAVKGVPGPAKGTLTATIETNQGKFKCEFFEKDAPNTVANFVGLARGLRPWKDPKTGEWVKKPFYNGLIFHRVIPSFMIQGGDPMGTGMGDPGYEFADEVSSGLKFDKPGLMAMANRGPNTNGSQFFITEGLPEQLNGHYSIFGLCDPVSLVSKIARVEKGPSNKPKTDVVIEKVTIQREKAAKSKAADK